MSTKRRSAKAARVASEVVKSHVNYVVADTARWEQSAAYVLDTPPRVAAFVKNSGCGLAMSYLHNGQMHDYLPDFIVRLGTDPSIHLVLETKGFDLLEDVEVAAARRWVAAGNSDGSRGRWAYAIVKRIADIRAVRTDTARVR